MQCGIISYVLQSQYTSAENIIALIKLYLIWYIANKKNKMDNFDVGLSS